MCAKGGEVGGDVGVGEMGGGQISPVRAIEDVVVGMCFVVVCFFW